MCQAVLTRTMWGRLRQLHVVESRKSNRGRRQERRPARVAEFRKATMAMCHCRRKERLRPSGMLRRTFDAYSRLREADVFQLFSDPVVRRSVLLVLLRSDGV